MVPQPHSESWISAWGQHCSNNAADDIQERENYGEHSNIKYRCFSEHKLAGAKKDKTSSLVQSLGLRLFYIFERSGTNKATDMVVSHLLGSIIAIISAHVPGQHIWASVGQGLSSSSPKQWKSDGSVKIYNSFSARSPLTKSKKEKIIESAAIEKRAC